MVSLLCEMEETTMKLLLYLILLLALMAPAWSQNHQSDNGGNLDGNCKCDKPPTKRNVPEAPFQVYLGLGALSLATLYLVTKKDNTLS